ncbi:MAG: hypothetical protein K0R17_1346 [Rariglobus sp.]|jgi:hypothetical protein|nr:hypothetical protein [Rariglobus sp.]
MEQPPGFQRRVVFDRRQGIGLLLLLVLPVLALFQQLGDRVQTLEASGDGLVLRAEAPMSARYGDALQLRLTLIGPAGPEARRVNVEIAEDYLARFTDVNSRPEMVRFTDKAGMLEQELPREGGSVPVVIELTPEEYGWARGYVRASLASGASVELAIKTFVYP